MNKIQRLLIFFAMAISLFTFPLYVTNQYFLTVSIFIFIYCVLTLGYRMIMKVGEVSFGHAAFMGIGAYTSALLTMRLEMSFWIAWIIACALTALVAFILGALAVRTKGVHFFLVTLAMGETLRLIGINWNAPLLGGPNGIFGIPSPTAITFGSFTIDFESRIALYFLSLFALVIVILIALCLDRSRVGRMWDAIGQDDKLAAVIGINVYGHKLASFVLSSTIAGLAGVIFAHFMTYISPYDFTFFFAMQLIIYVIFGGAATIYGPLIGVGVLVTISEALRKVGSYEVIFYGFIFLIVLRFFPQGIVSFISQLIESRRNLTNTTAVDP